jgi:drug/metabolite transporter (DMT)-like permease
LSGVSPLAVATGSQLAATVVLLPPALWLWPTAAPSTLAWASVAGLALLCTAVAYLLYFRLIDHLGAARAITVTFLIPVFGVVWGTLFLAEAFTSAMGLGCAVILLGTALTTGVLRWPVRAAA